MNIKTKSIVVFTHRDVEFLINLKGTTSWVLNPAIAMNCEYVVCTANSKSELSKKEYENRSAFLIGKVKDVRQALNLPRDAHRYMIEFDEYALINNKPNYWQKGRNPIKYIDTDDLNIDFDLLEWNTIDKDRNLKAVEDYFKIENAYYEQKEKVSGKFKEKKLEDKRKQSFVERLEVKSNSEGLSIAEAKEGLSKHYEIDQDNIEIILKG